MSYGYLYWIRWSAQQKKGVVLEDGEDIAFRGWKQVLQRSERSKAPCSQSQIATENIPSQQLSIKSEWCQCLPSHTDPTQPNPPPALGELWLRGMEQCRTSCSSPLWSGLPWHTKMGFLGTEQVIKCPWSQWPLIIYATLLVECTYCKPL